MVNIQDSKTKVGLPGVAVVVFDYAANIITTLYTDKYGQLDTSYFLYNIGPSFVGLDYNGYPDATYSVNYLLNHSYIYMPKLESAPAVPAGSSVQQKAAAYERANNAIIEKSNLVKYAAVGIGAALLVIASQKKKKKKVSGFKDLPPQAQNAIVIGAVGLASYFLIFGKKNNYNQGLPDAAGNDLDYLANMGQYPTISATEAESYAGMLVGAFNDCGTDEEIVYNVFRNLNNTADVLLLVKTYGVRDYKGCFSGDYFSDHHFNLGEALADELSAGEISKVNEILSQKGIDYKF